MHRYILLSGMMLNSTVCLVWACYAMVVRESIMSVIICCMMCGSFVGMGVTMVDSWKE